MHIFCMSDLHLEFGGLTEPIPTGDILILAGDITLLCALEPHRTDADARKLRKRTLAFFDQCRASFKRVFYLLGNHEAYRYDIDKAPATVRRQLVGIELLDDTVVDLGDNILLVGGTLWTDMNEGRDAFVVAQGMNDFSCIKAGERLFRPQDAMAKFTGTKHLIETTAKANPEKTIVVATHHAPSPHGLGGGHAGSMINAGYYTNLHALIEAHPNIKFWLHGHTHLQSAYRIGDCQIITNARGYLGHDASAKCFDMNCWFDPTTGELGLPFPTVEEDLDRRRHLVTPDQK